MLADADICNMALSHLAISTRIQSIDPPDQTAAASNCAFWYPKMRDWLLKIAPWDFAYANLALASDTTVFPGWAYAYQYPADCLQLIAVTTQAGMRFGQLYWSYYWGNFTGLNGSVPKIPSKVVRSTMAPGMKAILCDLSPANPVYAFYIQQVTDTGLFDPLFCDGLAFDIAARIGGPLRADPQKVGAATQAGNAMRAQAVAQMMNQSQQDPERVSPSISCRW